MNLISYILNILVQAMALSLIFFEFYRMIKFQYWVNRFDNYGIDHLINFLMKKRSINSSHFQDFKVLKNNNIYNIIYFDINQIIVAEYHISHGILEVDYRETQGLIKYSDQRVFTLSEASRLRLEILLDLH